MTTRFVTRHGKRIAIGTLKPEPARRHSFTLVPRVWSDRLAEIGASGGTYKLALELLSRTWRAGQTTVKLGEVPHMSRPTRRVALCQLESAGLVKVERSNHAAPIVTTLLVE
jgi:hypothetical protein